MIEIIQSTTFSHWLNNLKDRQARARIQVRLDRMRNRNFGDIAPVGQGLSEARIHYGPGIGSISCNTHKQVVVLLSGGDKHRQSRDIEQAKIIAKEWTEHTL